MYCENIKYNIDSYLTAKAYYGKEAIDQVSRLIAMIYAQIDRVLPNGLHDLFICSDVDLQFVRNMLYEAPKSIHPDNATLPYPKNRPQNSIDMGYFYRGHEEKHTEWMKRRFQTSLFHLKTMWVFQQVRDEIHRRQLARITPEMRALTAAKNAMNQVNQLDMLRTMTEKQLLLVSTEIDPVDGRRISPKRLKDEQAKLRSLNKSIADMIAFIDDVENDKVEIPSPPKPLKAWKQATTGRTDKRSGKKWNKWVQMSLPENELPDTYDRAFAERSYQCTQELRAIRSKRSKNYPFDMYLLRDKQRSYEYAQSVKQEKTNSLQGWVNHKLGLNINLQSLYTPQWSYVPPSVWNPGYYAPSPKEIMQNLLDPKNEGIV